MRSSLLAIALMLFLGLPALAENPYQKIDTHDEAQALLTRVAGSLGNRFGMEVQRPVHVEVKTGKQLDGISGKVEGDENIVLQEGQKGDFELYVLAGWDHDVSAALLSYGLSLAWTMDNCPPEQSDELRSAFAQWVTAVYLRDSKVYELSRELPDYLPTGMKSDQILKQLFAWQDKVGARGVVSLVRSSTKLPSPGEAAPNGYRPTTMPTELPPGYSSNEEDPENAPPGYNSPSPSVEVPGYDSNEEEPEKAPRGYNSPNPSLEVPGYGSDEEDPENAPAGYDDD